MDFARLWEQARELWSRPIGKVVFSGVALFVILLAAASVLLTRPQYATLGSFSQQDAPKVAAKLLEKKIPYRQEGNGFTFLVPQEQLNTARLVLAETDLDPASSAWSPDLWKNRISWSNTDFDKRINRIEQIEANLTRQIMALSVVERAFVQITVPMEKPLFKEQEKSPKANVVIYPRKGEKLDDPGIVQGIMEIVAVVEGLEPKNVVVMDASTSRVVSSDVFKVKDAATLQAEQRHDLLSIQNDVQERYRKQLTDALEKVVGAGNVSVIVNLSLNWDKVQTEAVTYSGANAGKGIILSEQKETSTSEGTPGTTPANPVGTTPNAEQPRSPTYPGTQASGAGNISAEGSKQIINYLVNQINTKSEKPGGGIEEISVGVLVNQGRVNSQAMSQAITNVVTTAMGKKAQVSVEAVPFAEDLMKLIEPRQVNPGLNVPDWLYWVLGVALGLAAIAFFVVATRPRRPVLQPVFAGPEAAMMGGIPVTEVELPPPVAATVQEMPEQVVPETADALARLTPAEAAKLSDEVLKQLGADPEQVRLLEQIEKIAKTQPEQIANLLRTWISEE